MWEIAIKHALGKLELLDGLEASFWAMERSNLRLLELEQGHVPHLAGLPLHHRDPFDRMLIAQAKHEGMSILTVDPAFNAYGVPLLSA
ncbi:MAG TPA: type II toxin-antitoxin system VapC family toxin [Flavobacteriales bacterium]|nr:type II toxin-antitoxin system VapC family toxin [Flavobacteriales bacterium]HNI03323.1 type II toxin-antitoxin system VapC family toxin [Flavobacteriales bacterium]